METNDLMIGDYFRFFGDLVRIIGISEDDVFVIREDVEQKDIVDADKLEPIPITKEFLEKNGFESIAPPISQFRWISDDERTEVVLHSSCLSVIKNLGYEDEEEFVLPLPAYVHELQHAMRLLGIEKEIEL